MYYGLIIITMLMGFIAQAYISSSFKKYARVSNGTGLTGAQIARRMLDENGLSNVEIQPIAGSLTDHYDPSTRVVRLSEDVYGVSSVSAMAVACHECGHAVQHARGYVPMSIRSALVPVANFGSSAWLILLIAGFVLGITGLIWLAIILYSFAVLFHVVTLPVEFNASHRGLAYIRGNGSPSVVNASTAIALPGDVRADGAKRVLTAAALTYVVGALTSITQLLYYLAIFGRD